MATDTLRVLRRAGRCAAVLLWLFALCGCRRDTEGAPVHVATFGSSTDFDAFAAYLWCEPGHDGPLPEEWRTAIGGVEATRGVAPSAAADWRSYIGQAAGRNELHLDRGHVAQSRAAWLASRGDELPRRPFDLADEAVVRELTDRVARHTALRPGADFVALGDEVGTTPYGDPLDFARGGDAPTTDAALGLLSGADVAGFRARREAEREELLGVLDRLCDAARSARPDVRLGLLGIGQATPFVGPTARDLAARFDVLEAYDEGLAREAIATAAHADHTLLRTVFTETRAATAWQVFEHMLRGGDGVVLWQRRELLARPAVADELVRALAAVRWLRGEHNFRGARPSGVAILTDVEGDAALWLDVARRERLTWPRRLAGFEAREGPAFVRRTAFVSLFEEVGASPGVFDIAELADASWSQRFPLLVVSGLDLGRRRVVDAVQLHLQRGGFVVLDENKGALAGARVLRAPHGLDAGFAPSDAASPRAVRRRATAQELLARGAGQGSNAIDSADGAPLFIASNTTADGSKLVVALQACQNGADRARLAPWRAVVRTHADRDDSRAHWLVDGARLDASQPLDVPAGWPAILLVDARQVADE